VNAAVSEEVGRAPIDELYERALQVTLQVLVN